MAGESKGLAIGIDLGTTYSCVAVWRHGQVEVIVNGQGNRTTPSYVAFSGTDRLVGDAAKNQAARNTANTVFDAKRLIGRRFSDPTVQADAKLWPFKIVDGGGDLPKVSVQYNGEEKQFTAVEISSMILSNMREIAEARLGTIIKNAVITVPAYFNNSQRQATKDAASAAGLEVLRMINEPTAAAIAYGLDKNRWESGGKQKKVLVFDLGGGTFDVSVLTMSAGSLNVIATAGDNHLGGVDFDNRLVQHCVRLFEKKYDKDISGDSRAIRRLKVASERAKRNLSFVVETMIEVDYLHDGIDFQCAINVAKFEELNADLFNRCMDLVDSCLHDAKLKKEDVDEVLLVGGSTRIPKIQELLREAFTKSSISKGINPDEAVASGAAIRAAMLGGDHTQLIDDLVLSDVTSLSLGVHTVDGLMNVIISRNTAIPAQCEMVFTTAIHNQTRIKVQVFEGERAMTRDNNLLGEFVLSGIQPASKGKARIAVKFELNEDSILVVTAEDQETKVKSNITINTRSEGKSATEVKRLVEEAKAHEKEDVERRKQALATNNLRDYACNLSNKVKDNNTVKMKAKENMEKAISETLTWLENMKMVSAEQVDTKERELDKKWNAMLRKADPRKSNRLRFWPWKNEER